MKRALITLAAVGAAVLFATQANAAINGYTTVGSSGVQTGTDGVVTLPINGYNSVNWISTYGGVNGAVSGGTDGSTATIPFTVYGNKTLNFNFDYVTSDGSGYPDFATVDLYNSSNTLLATIDSWTTTVTAVNAGTTWSPLGPSSGSCYATGCGNTGWSSLSYLVSGSGNYYLTFSVANANDTEYDTGLAFTVANTPEPATLGMFGLGLTLLSFLGLRRRRSRA